MVIEARRFPLTVVKKDNQEAYERHIVLSKEQLQAAQLVGQSSTELIKRICERQGYEVVYIGKPKRKSILIDLNAVWDGVRNG